MEGTFKGWVAGKAFGFISPDDNSPDVFVHQRAAASIPQLKAGARVAFEAQATEKGRNAVGLTLLTVQAPLTRGRGRVKFWNERGFGFIAPDGGGPDVFVHSAVLPMEEQGYLREGDVVEFSVSQGIKGLEAHDLSVVGWTTASDHLAAFADMGAPGWLDNLADLAEKEPWDYTHATAPEPLPILRSYVRYTFRRLEEMEGGIGVSKKRVRVPHSTQALSRPIRKRFTPSSASTRE